MLNIILTNTKAFNEFNNTASNLVFYSTYWVPNKYLCMGWNSLFESE